ncbi:lyase family protein [Amycolatopsis sp. NPDC059021]|uniref:lyase family protein n=1 Tax=Amycolatopsis sp. NPDC059021 TaxID=3346704 RepID=UPI00366F8099
MTPPAGGTGRLARGLSATARAIVFADVVDAELDTELRHSSTVDLAHVVMLERAGLIGAPTAAVLLTHIQALRDNGFAPLRGRHAPRGAYLLYEEHLIGVTGIEHGGKLHLGRSRNDLKATTLRLRLRERIAVLLRETLRSSAVLLSAARRHRATVMPAYTQYQPAVPITYGHWLLGAATAMGRHVEDLFAVEGSLRECPLGASAIGGSDLPIDAAVTARLLGFDGPVPNSVDAVAARDHVLRALAAAGALAVTASRLATDLLLWCTAENPLLSLPDELVGSSSAMPQKRNPFLLEHVRAKSAHVAAAWTAAAGAMHGTPFGNSVEAGTEGTSPVWDGLATTLDALVLLRLVLTRARPRGADMLERADTGGTTATALANRLTRRGMPFRAAHRVVGEAVREVCAAGPVSGDRLATAVARRARDLGGSDADLDRELRACTVSRVTELSDYGGGPGPASFAAGFGAAAGKWAADVARLGELRRGWAGAETELARAVAALTARSGS